MTKSLVSLALLTSSAAAATPTWCVSDAHGYNCEGNTVKTVQGITAHNDCCTACIDYGDNCRAWTWHYPTKECMLKSACKNVTSSQDYHTSWPRSGPSPPPAPPTPPAPPPSPPSPTGRKGSFLVIGDWGHDPSTHGSLKTAALQKTIAAQMLSKFKELGDVKFIVNVGDSFYPAGVNSKSDGKWQSRWRDIYASELRSVPWYSVYGNHDMYDDKNCACGARDGSQCSQLNSDINNKDFFYMPSVNWYKEHPELGLEVVALDYNEVSEHPCTYGSAHGCASTCSSNLKSRASSADAMLKERYQSSSHKNMVVFSHYPVDYLNANRKSMLKDGSKHNIAYFGGHRHSVDQKDQNISPNEAWLVGGGGGWGCDGSKQGFVVGELFEQKITTYAVYSDSGLCNKFAEDASTEYCARCNVTVAYV